jgi:probable HAF family extracellular repeat protein
MKLRLALLAALLFTSINLPRVYAQEDEGFSVSFSVVDLGSVEHPDQENCADVAPGATITAIAAGSRAVGSTYIDDERAVASLFSTDGIRSMQSGPGGGVANAINRQNQIAGAIYSLLPDQPCGRPSGATPAVWDEDFDLRSLDLPQDATSGAATAINTNGDVAGWLNTDAGRRTALWHDDDIIVISHAAIEGIERLSSAATDMNEAGLVTGTMAWSDGETRHQRPFVWDGVSVQFLDPTRGQDGFANAINDSGVVAGAVIGRDGLEQATLWWRGQLTDLPNLDDRPASVATDVNNAGVVVGYCAREDGLSRASIWINGEVVDLNEIIPQDLGWQLQVAIGINDDGLIAGWGDLDGVRHAFLLVPAAG